MIKNGVFNITYPVYYIIYFDGEKLRAYIPTLGNMYNVKYNCAYGREPEIEALKSDSIYSKAEVDSKCWEEFRKHKESFSNLTWEKEVNGKN